MNILNAVYTVLKDEKKPMRAAELLAETTLVKFGVGQ